MPQVLVALGLAAPAAAGAGITATAAGSALLGGLATGAAGGIAKGVAGAIGDKKKRAQEEKMATIHTTKPAVPGEFGDDMVDPKGFNLGTLAKPIDWSRFRGAY